MRFLKNILKRYPKQTEWGPISLSIAVGFENARKEWFVDVCVKQMQGFIKCFKGPTTDINAELSDALTLLFKAYQLGSISGFLDQQKYLQNLQMQNFCDLFGAQVCGTEVLAVSKLIEEFLELDLYNRDIHLARRVAEHLTGKVAPLPETALLAGMVPAFSIFNRIAVASAFGDRAKVAELEKLIDQWIAGLDGHFQRIFDSLNKSAVAA